MGKSIVGSRTNHYSGLAKRTANLLVTLGLVFLLLGMMGCSDGGSSAPVASPPSTENAVASYRILPIVPIAQQTPVWCWAAAAEMVFRYYGLPNLNFGGNYQCGIVAAYYGPYSACYANCFSCVSAIGGMGQMQILINNYGLVANQFFPSRILTSRLLFNALPLSQVISEIDAGRPILAGISPGGFVYPNISQHVVLIVGYDTRGVHAQLIVNDPFPYTAPQFAQQLNPYAAVNGQIIQPGQYSISYSAFISPMNWANTVDYIQ